MHLFLPLLITVTLHARPSVRDAFVCASLLETSAVKEADATFDRTFGVLQDQTHRKMQEIFGRAARGLDKIRALLELTGSWGRLPETSLDDLELRAMGDGKVDQRRLKSITHRLWRVRARTPMVASNLVAAREVIVGEAAIRQRLTQIRAAALRRQAEFDRAPAAPPHFDRVDPWRFTTDLLGALAAGALAFYDTTSAVHAVAGGHYLWAAAHAGVFYVLARPILRAKIESVYLSARAVVRNFRKPVTTPRAAADAQLAHVDEVLKMLKSKSKGTFAFFGSTIDLDLRRTNASTHPWRRTAPTAGEIRAAAVENKDRPLPWDRRRLEVDTVFRYDEELENFVYAIHAWEPPYSTESKLWGW